MERSTLEKKYYEQCIPALNKEFGYKNPFEVPRLVKVVINTSIKEATSDSKVLDAVVKDLATIAGQHPVITRARKSISNFKLRAGQPIGCMVTLRRKQMYEFMNRLINVAIPRMRDFKGVPGNSFDKKGNYTLGLTEQTLFPEIIPDKVTKIFGMNVTFVTTGRTDKEGKALLKFMGMPFKD